MKLHPSPSRRHCFWQRSAELHQLPTSTWSCRDNDGGVSYSAGPVHVGLRGLAAAADLPKTASAPPGRREGLAVTPSVDTSQFNDLDSALLGSLRRPFPQTPKHARRAFSALNNFAPLPLPIGALIPGIQVFSSSPIPDPHCRFRTPAPDNLAISKGATEAGGKCHPRPASQPVHSHNLDKAGSTLFARCSARYAFRCDGARPPIPALPKTSPTRLPTIHRPYAQNMTIRPLVQPRDCK